MSPRMIRFNYNGRGTALKDIPNVASKLSKKRNDETFKTLHLILFGRRGKAMQVKSNISQFSGFVWHENEEKQRLKIKEKLDKCVKEKLFEFCDVFDIPVVKITAKKEEIVTKLLDFLAAPAPHATSTVVLSEKEKSDTPSKRKRVAEKTAHESGGTSAKHSSKKQRKSEVIPKILEKSESESDGEKGEDDESDRSVPEGSEDEVSEHSESKEKVSNSGEESEGEKHSPSSAKKVSPVQTKSKKVTAGKKETPVTSPKKSSTAKPFKVIDSSEKSPVVFSRKKKTEETANKKSSALSKSSSKQNDSEDNSGKSGKGKDEALKEAGAPSEQDLRKVIREVLGEVDLNKATFIDILKQLGEHFNLDLTPRKTDIKLMVKEELTKLNEEDDDGESDAEEETPKPKPARREAQQKTPKTPLPSAEKKDSADSDGRCRRSDGKKWRCKKDVVAANTGFGNRHLDCSFSYKGSDYCILGVSTISPARRYS
ncbi:Dek-like [Thalictrum thalictroides]|uniref:Dek-like n=1 Tax=Thalictrum thalictroides TaxID=46969 RepID=A0A7J6XDC1_THATH|nr:Dek-like [Thalictrum thalictroides]